MVSIALTLWQLAGTASCRSCHQGIAASYQQTAHSRTSSAASADTIRGSFEAGHDVLRTPVKDVQFKMERRGDAFFQTGFDHGRARTERFDIVIGSGRRSQAYLYRKNGLLFQLPVSFLASTGSWINSPGYPNGEVYFDRLIPTRCLNCHMTGAQDEGPFFAGITCEKCHGPGERHERLRNPARFTRDEKVALCAACHEGRQDEPTNDVHGNQVGLLRRSKCFEKAASMSCTTCHDVHQVQRDVVAMSARCIECHSQPVPSGVRRTPTCRRAAASDNCIDCHMPLQRSRVITFETAGRELAQTFRTHTIAVY
jgi:hypothetical protein